MRKTMTLAAVGLGLMTVPAAAAGLDEATLFDARRTRVYRGGPGQPLRAVSSPSAAAAVAQFLRERGASASTARSLRQVAQARARTGLTHVRFEQEVAGLRLADAYVKAAFGGRGELVHLIDNTARVTGRPEPAAISEGQALRAALHALHPRLTEDHTAVRRDGNVTLFEKTRFFHAGPRVERVAIAMNDGTLETGFHVETWSDRGNLLHHTLVGGDGRVLAVELRTNTDSYNIFPDHPDNSNQTIVDGPGPGNTPSPIGWLSGPQTSVDIAGNNAHAYLDTDANGTPDAGGTPVADGNFLTTADLTASPGTPTNRNVAVQNLFYFNNVIHDTLYTHGFVEGTGNFQEDNFGLGGREGDSVNAEAQDGAGTDNANFATPGDGRNPRMQMFLWTGKGDHQVVASSVTYRAQGAAFGAPLTPAGVSGALAVVDDGTGTPSDGCEAITADLTGKVAVMDRGTCNFTVKVKNAQVAGAAAAVIANHVGDSIFTMGGDDPSVTIGAVFVGQTDGAAIKAAAGSNGTARRTDPPPLQRDGDLDSDIIWHEYGHGLTWRMIGRMQGALSGAIGEGMSDVLAILVNEDDTVGEYSFDDPLGIRSAPYTNYGRTYADVTGAGGVHFDGEVYAAIGWRLFENFQAAAVPKETLFDYLVDGMNFTPAAPSFEDMRDGILQSEANAPLAAHECLIWDAFADYGVGVGATARVRGPTILVTESFALPAGCTAIP